MDDHDRHPLDHLLSEQLRVALEERYWRPIETLCTLEELVSDDEFVTGTRSHIALYSDHGVVHARDVAARALELAASVDGLQLPARPPERLRIVQGIAVLLAYLHDIGMVDSTHEGRSAHPQFAAQTPYTAAFEDLLDEILDTDAGGLRSHLTAIDSVAPFAVPVAEVLREVLATAIVHSKTAVPAELLADVQALRELLQGEVFSPLPGQDRSPADDGQRDQETSFAWFTSTDPAHRELADDVLDANRVVRVADALRQRGTALRTSAGYEIFLEPSTGAAIACLRTSDKQRKYFLRFFDPVSTGEANVRYSEVTQSGALRFAFHRGDFPTPELTAGLASGCSWVVLDVADDVLPTFAERFPAAGLPAPRLVGGEQTIELMVTDGAIAFAHAVKELVVTARPDLVSRVHVLDHDPVPLVDDVDWSNAGSAVDSGSDLAAVLRPRLVEHGLAGHALDGTRLVRVSGGTTVMHAGRQGSWVLVPLGRGLEVQPLGGYPALPLPPFGPLGVTAVVRGSERNATVVAAADVDLLAIPGELFLRRWFHPFDKEGLRDELIESSAPT